MGLSSPIYSSQRKLVDIFLSSQREMGFQKRVSMLLWLLSIKTISFILPYQWSDIKCVLGSLLRWILKVSYFQIPLLEI